MKKNNGASLIEYRAPSPITFYYLVFDMRQTA